MKIKTLLLAATFGLCVACNKAVVTSEPFIIPEPQKMEITDGVYPLRSSVSIGVSDSTLTPAATLLQGILSQPTGFTVPVSTTGDIQLSIDPALSNQEGYKLNVTANGITIVGGSYGGVIYGIETLRQLLPKEIEQPGTTVAMGVPFVSIEDAPRFAWRGYMLDVSRHFYTVEEVKKMLDRMAFYKLNRFHWHLTDDQGWRIEIKQYPLLTEKGGWRKFNNQDRECQRLEKEQDNPDFIIDPTKTKIVEGDTLYGGYYTQEEIKEVVAYAKIRNIEVIPEVDMPGHFLAAIENYKGISCSDEIGWGELFSSPICPGKESALEFCKNVYSEIFNLFPYHYVHLGADEVEKSNWKKCPDCQRRMREHKLKDEYELQAWFVKSMEKQFLANGKTLIGWDEIIDGGAPKTATIMWWRNWAPKAIETATSQGNPVIYTPNFTLYFDFQQDKNTLKTVYTHNPMPKELSAEQQKLFLGVQANLWAEWIPSMARSEYMTFPRMLALSEMGWCNDDKKEWEHFIKKVVQHYARFDIMGINYRPLDIEGFSNTNTFTEPSVLDLSTPQKGVTIRYTTDGTAPNENSALYTQPIPVDTTTEFTLRIFRPNGTKSDFVKTKIIIEGFAPAVEGVTSTEPGLTVKWYDYKGSKCAEIESAKSNGEYIVENVSIPEKAKGNIGLIFSGYFDAPEDGIYSFSLLSDDGSMMYIDGVEVINNDGNHSPREITGQKALKKGLHKMEVRYFDHNGGQLKLQTIDNEGKLQDFPKERFKH